MPRASSKARNSQDVEPAAPRSDEDTSTLLTVMVEVSGKTLLFHVRQGQGAAVSDVKEMIQEKTKIPRAMQRLAFKGRILQDHDSLQGYNGATLHMQPKLAGGAEAPCEICSVPAAMVSLCLQCGLASCPACWCWRHEMCSKCCIPLHKPPPRPPARQVLAATGGS